MDKVFSQIQNPEALLPVGLVVSGFDFHMQLPDMELEVLDTAETKRLKKSFAKIQ